MANPNQNESGKKRGIKSYLPLIIIVLVVVIAGSLWYKEYTKYISTDDAYVDSDKVNVSSKTMGRIAVMHFSEGDAVKQGELVVELDSSELSSQKAQAISLKNQAIAGQKQAEARLAFDKTNIKIIEIGLEKAKDDYKRAEEQFSGGVITSEKMDNVSKALEVAKAQMESAKSQLEVSRAQLASSEAAVKSSDSQISIVETQLKNTKIFAPADGVLARRWMLPGDIAQPGQAIFTISKNQNLWITVYLEETKLGDVKTGQDVKFTIDAYGDRQFKGKVFYIASNTASQFSLIPPNNASGNFTKVTQRVPLKVSIDGLEDGGKLEDLNLLAGMSAVIKIVR
ncbi:MAG: HlyD family secretion protein [Bacteroidales bacterium]|nr:HlyD family secretion protein [Bacteroidales bacterium]